ncbi:hypothetical protein [Streptomyces cinnamoneus]|uniref:hypothetical protein n=1 Tax=Streptomyces cinnamoneus TaxID=53446 RepID=UPI001EFEE97A|nr:hypothetical protein [Streptomyces cinnamoneus]
MTDEDWERFARDTEQSIRESAPKEPSARARMVTDRLRRQDEAAAKARRKGLGGFLGRGGGNVPPSYPEGWRTGPAWQEMNGKAARKRRILGGVGVVLAVAVGATFVLNPGDVLSRIPGGWGKEKEAPASSEGTATLDRPFAGSPAEEYADGAAGIVLPEATAVGQVPKERVASALQLTKDFLVAANLDPATLRGERPAAALDLLDPEQEGMIAKASASLREPDRENDPLTLFSRFDPDEVRVVGGAVKTQGRMTFAEGKGGVVTIHADYTFVYPLTKKDKGSRQVARSIVRRVVDTEILDPARFSVTPGKLVIARHMMDIGNTTCDVHDGFIHPRFPRLVRHGEKEDESGPSVDPYDRSRELGAEDEVRRGECGKVTRT